MAYREAFPKGAHGTIEFFDCYLVCTDYFFAAKYTLEMPFTFVPLKIHNTHEY